MDALHAIILGIVQGLTEFLPISSSAHLELVPWFANWDDFEGNQDLETAFDVAVHLGTLVGAVAYLWQDVVRLTVAGVRTVVFRESSTDGRIAWLLVATMIPAAIVGVLASDLRDSLDDDIWLTGVTLIVFGLLLLYADRLGGDRSFETFGVRDAVVFGLAQACALQPGVSRSGVTVTAARWRLFDRSDAARLVFLMSIPIIAAAGLYAFVDIGGFSGVPADFRWAFFWGTVGSAITGWVAVWGLLAFVRRYDFTVFVIYRVLLGASVLTALATGWR
ncbi:MAG: undecaprenyl-diphosphate phosphatase [Acidimicrobiales bacterium]